ncbi:MAG TPA: carbohydrate kinase family protein [Clostridia bacterium]|nr:carbohydrate kinase family protein [Clostridia bacterium]
MKEYVVVAGGINVDIKGKAFDKMDIGSSSPGAIEISPGGVGRNIAHNLALLDVPVMLLGAVGSDAQGIKVLQDTGDCGVCVEHILRTDKSLTGTYIALLDNAGEMVAALSDMHILELLDVDYFKSKLAILKNAAYIVCDANLTTEAIAFIISVANSCNIPVCLEPVSVKKALKLRNHLNGIDFITPNMDELAVLSEMNAENTAEHMAAQLIKSGVKNVITTLGQKGLCYTNKNGSRYYQSIPNLVSDVTGAGDSLTAGFLYGLMKHSSIERALICGLAAAAITVGSKETVSSQLSVESISRLALQFNSDCVL